MSLIFSLVNFLSPSSSLKRSVKVKLVSIAPVKPVKAPPIAPATVPYNGTTLPEAAPTPDPSAVKPATSSESIKEPSIVAPEVTIS